MKKWHSVLWAVFASLALGGVLGYVNYKKTQPSQITIATVNGHDIKLLDFQKSLMDIKSQIEMYREYARSTGISVDLFLSMAGLLDPEKSAFDKCLNNRLLDTQKDFYNIELDHDYFIKELANKLPAYMKDGVGNINMDIYMRYLARMNTKPSEFEERMERNFERDFFEDFLMLSNYITLGKAKEVFTNNIAKKSFDVLLFPMSHYLKQVKRDKINTKEIEKFFNKNKENYRVLEKRKAFYWMLNSEDYAKKVVIDESMIQYFYDRNKDSLFRIPPKVKVRHIFFKVKKGDSPEKIEELLSKAKDIRKEVVKDSSLFKDLAAKFSDDKKSSSSGGLLAFFDKGTYDVEFEKAAYRLHKIGDVSDIVKTKDGFELIQLEQRIPASAKALEKVRDEISKTLRAKKALTNLRVDIQKIIYEARTDKQAPLRFVQENNLKQQKSDFLVASDSAGDKVINVLADKIFTSKKKKGEFGSFIHEDDRVLYQLVSVQKSFIPEFKEVEKDVLANLYKDMAKRNLKVDIKKSKRELIDKSKTIKEIAKDNGFTIITTKAIGKSDELKELSLDSSFAKRAFVLNSPDQALTFRNNSDYYLIQVNNIEQTALLPFADEKDKIINSEKNRDKGLYLQGFIASLLRNARIEKLEKFMNADRRQG